MKSQFSLTCILGSAVFLYQLVSGTSVAAGPQFSLVPPRDVQECATDIAENIHKTAIAILSVPLDQQTFENTLRPWNRLAAELSRDFIALEAQQKENSPSHETASQILNDLKAYLLEVTQNPELHQTIMNCSLSTAHNTELDPFQRYIGARFIKNGSNEPVYLQGALEEKNTSATDFTVSNLKSESTADGQFSDLANAILSEDTDVVCIQDILADDHAYDLYETIRNNYAHFIYIPPAAALDLSESCYPNGMLVGSKYRMEQTRFNTFQEEVTGSTERFFDFILKNAGRPLGHVYAANLKTDALDDTISYKFIQIMEKMQDDFSKIEERSIPFLLCGNFLNILHGSQESTITMDAHFGHEDNSLGTSSTLLLQSLPGSPNKNVDIGHAISTISMTMVSSYPDLLTVVKRENPNSIDYAISSILNHQHSLGVQKMDACFRDKLKIVPIKSHKDTNDKAGGEVKGGIKYKWGGKDGSQLSTYFEAEVHDDHGNYCKGEAEHNISTGEGNADCHGGYKTEFD